MVATTYMWVLDRKVVATQSIYTVEASNKDQALLMDIRKKDMATNITIIFTFMMLEPLNWSPSVCETNFQLRGGDYQLSGCYYQLTDSDYQLTSSYILTKIFTPRGANFFTNGNGYKENCLLLQQEGVCGPLSHSHQDHTRQQASVKIEAISRKKYSFMVT